MQRPIFRMLLQPFWVPSSLNQKAKTKNEVLWKLIYDVIGILNENTVNYNTLLDIIFTPVHNYWVKPCNLSGNPCNLPSTIINVYPRR